jgi:hypothetical protein
MAFTVPDISENIKGFNATQKSIFNNVATIQRQGMAIKQQDAQTQFGLESLRAQLGQMQASLDSLNGLGSSADLAGLSGLNSLTPASGSTSAAMGDVAASAAGSRSGFVA